MVVNRQYSNLFQLASIKNNDTNEGRQGQSYLRQSIPALGPAAPPISQLLLLTYRDPSWHLIAENGQLLSRKSSSSLLLISNRQ